MHKLKFSILLLIISILPISAQKSTDAETLINNLLNNIKSTPFRTEFTLSINQKNELPSQAMSGTFTMKGKKFYIESEIIKVWFDGKTQWGLNTQSNEVSISEPTEQELTETNPLTVIAAYKTKCNIRLSKIKSNKFDIIELIPKVKNNDFTKIEVRIERSTGNPNSISIFEKSGNTSVLVLSNFKKGVTVTDSYFVFDKSKFKGITVNDLR